MLKKFILKKLEETKTYDPRVLILSRIGVYSSESQKVEYTKRYVFTGPFNDGERTYYQIFPSMEPFYDYGEDSLIFLESSNTHLSDIFPDLTKVTKKQINKITDELYKSDSLTGKYIPDDEDPDKPAKLSLGNKHGIH